ncbi:MAG TPA: hypothetical protein ENI61_03935 [Ignavibacteria bacterium]|nr:hypothetical protein [Ignavibacteria bacterium]
MTLKMIKVRYRLNTLNGIKFYVLNLNQIEQGFLKSLLKRDSYYNQSQILDVDLYIGSKDKNGKEIYERDIIKHKDKFGNGMGIVEFNFPSFRLKDKNGFCDDWNWEKEFEVIGNIYENKDLTGDLK